MSDNATVIPSPLPFILYTLLYITIIALGFLMVAPALLLQGWVVTIFWGWFIVPFFKVPALPLAIAVGLRLTMRLLIVDSPIITNKNDGNTSKDRLTYAFVMAFFAPLFVLGMGYLVHLYV